MFLLGNDLNSKAFVTTRAQLREENKQVQRAGKNVEKSKIKPTDIGLVDTQLEEDDLHSLFSDNKQLIDNDSDLDAQEYKTADTQVDIDVKDPLSLSKFPLSKKTLTKFLMKL